MRIIDAADEFEPIVDIKDEEAAAGSCVGLSAVGGREVSFHRFVCGQTNHGRDGQN